MTNKTGIEKFKQLLEAGWEIISTGGTAKALTDAGIECTPVEYITNFPEMMGGRIKTLHPNVFAPILANREKPDHLEALEKFSVGDPIDVVVVNLYDFASKPDIENIDVGGPSMIRAAAKNCAHVCAVSDPADYDRVIDALLGEGPTDELKQELALKVFQHTSNYDAMIAAWMLQKIQAGEPFLKSMLVATH